MGAVSAGDVMGGRWVAFGLVVLMLGLPGSTSVRGQTAPLSGALGIEAAIAEALEHSPLLRPGARALEAAEIGRDRAEAAFALRVAPSVASGVESLGLIQQTAGLGVTRQLSTGGEIAASAATFRYGGALGDARDATATVRFTQPLWSAFGGVATASVEAARVDETRARDLARDARAAVVLDVFARYADALTRRHAFAAAEKAHERASLLRESTDARKAAGLATELEVMRASLLENETAAAVVVREEEVGLAADRLRRSLGRPMDAPLDLVDDETALERLIVGLTAATNPADVPALVARALASRMEVRDARARIGQARRSVDVARWQELPPVAVEAGYSRYGLFGVGQSAVRPTNGGWHIGIVTAGGVGFRQARTARRTAELQVRSAEEDAVDTTERVRAEVQAAARAVDRTARSLATVEARMALAVRQRELVELRDARGLSTSVDRVDAEVAILDAEMSLASARLDRLLALAALERAVGGLTPEAWRP